MTQNIPLAVALTILASVVFAVAATVQHYAVGEQVTDPASRRQLKGSELWAVVRSPRWLAGLLLSGVGAILQVWALLLAPLMVVQPLGVLAVPWTILLATRIHRHAITARMWVATAFTVAGTVAFAIVAIMHAAPTPVLNDALLVTGTVVGFAAAGVLALAGARGPRAWRCFFWSSAGAVVYGTESGVVKGIGEYVATRDWAGSLTFWLLGASIVAGGLLAGIWIQQGYATGPAEVVVGTLNAIGPVAAVAYGIAVLGEGALLTTTAALMMLAAAAVAIAGVVLLSRFHPTSGTDARRA